MSEICTKHWFINDTITVDDCRECLIDRLTKEIEALKAEKIEYQRALVDQAKRVADLTTERDRLR